MAILEKLRVKAGLLLAIVIGMALLAFVLSDLLDSGGSLFNRSKFEIAEVFGKSISYTDYINRVERLEQIQQLQTGQMSLGEEVTDQLRQAAWDNMIQDLLLEKQYDRLGIGVSQEELTDLIMGSQPHPYIAQLFTDPQTGIFNRQAFISFMQRMETLGDESGERAYYLFIENEIFRERLYTKYLTAISQGLYATSMEASRQQDMENKSVTADFIVRNFNSVPDSLVNITSQDVREYYRDHLNNYVQEESRDIRVAYFEVVPSEDDFQEAEDWINDIMEDFESAEDIEQFVTLESDEPYDNINYASGELPDTLNDFMFSAELGATFGPWFEDDAYRISRLAEINYLPDSARARHILLQATQTNVNTIFELADSLKNLIEGGADFAVLAMTNSVDNSAQVGGDLGWFREGEMVKSFSDSVFYNNVGDVLVVPSEFGLHVIEIMDLSRPVKKVQVGTIVHYVEPGDETDQMYYLSANEFAGLNNTYDEFITASEDESFSGEVQRATNVLPMAKSLPGIPSARQLIIWAYQADLHDVSDVFRLENMYVVATVDQIREKGYIPMENIRAELENEVRKHKKAEILMSELADEIGSSGSVSSVASRLGLQLQTATNVNYVSSTFGSAGVEPQLVAAALTLPENAVSSPITGENGVYVLEITDVSSTAGMDNQVNLQQRVSQNYSSMATYAAYDALEEMADIEDNRREFF